MTNERLISGVELAKPDFRARSSEVFYLGDDKVLKLYFPEVDAQSVEVELLNTRVAFEKGCTPMECFGKVRIDGRDGLILKRLAGCSLTNMPGKDPLIIFRAGKILADLHAAVHAKSSRELRDVRLVAANTLKNSGAFSFLSPEQAEKLEKYILALPESDSIIHLDFHTDNILCDGKNYQVIDWMTAARGDPLVEVSMMNFLHHDAELFPGSSKFKIFLMQLVRGGIYGSYIKNYERLTGRDRADSAKWDIIAYVLRLGIWNIEFERKSLQGKILAFADKIE